MATSSITDFGGGVSTGSGVVYNPNSTLDKDAFLKLLMTQLKYQDPTSPMDTDKMLSQTADMAVIESQENIRGSMETMVKQFNATSSYQLIGAVGKLADTGLNAVRFENQGAEYTDVLFFEEDFTNGTLVVTDEDGNRVRSFTIEEGFAGLTNIKWDGKDNSGNNVPAGTYMIHVDYKGARTGKDFTAQMGVYPIESVVLDKNNPMLLLGGEYYSLDQIVAIKERP
ncbi:MAG: flagellar hook capping FlgD N-terminal domain-containing protein [Campylobacterales bacterium]